MKKKVAILAATVILSMVGPVYAAPADNSVETEIAALKERILVLEKQAAENKAKNEKAAAAKSDSKQVKITGDVRVRYEYAKDRDQSPESNNRIRLNIFKPLTDNLIFSGRIESENHAGGDADMSVTQAFIAGKALGADTLLFGRIPLYLGQGLINGIGAEGNVTTGADGFMYQKKLGAFKLTGAVGKAGNISYPTAIAGQKSLNLMAGNMEYLGLKNTSITAAYLQDKHQEIIDTYAVGFKYTGLQNYGIKYEYGKNKSDIAKALSGNDGATAYVASVKYRGADLNKPGSYGAWIGYRNADTGFDVLSMGDSDAPEIMKNFDDNNPFNAYNMSNIKGFEYGLEYTVFQNATLTLQYGDHTRKTDNKNAENFMAAMEYHF
ncbi:DUF3373 family protein [Sporomusa acidovorans]|uniref:Porin domain-containing protein n=1 Tax=Sporomusa acidovorans (strain ATCC 49682 / DSM 3132 / Mol) TaxID=1123286 RepID=A0ABZ3J062_SPOA4|nr:DUF3373 family protein [Sporomusa acidovorans]OZC21384.1 hypothetical protein SPACI_20110 [Sporomusa acidovorans DSM 3132]SDE55701.1 Protein of unknown function [Sporomusa acidovorans]